MKTEQLKQVALAATPDAVMAANPAVILALLECVDALRAIEKRPGMSEGRAARAALQKLEAL